MMNDKEYAYAPSRMMSVETFKSAAKIMDDNNIPSESRVLRITLDHAIELLEGYVSEYDMKVEIL